jgi:hypothetical protein
MAAVLRVLKLFLWVIPVLLLAVAVGLVLWYKRDVLGKDKRLGSEIKELRTAKVEEYDFGLEKFDAAVAKLRAGEDEEGRKALLAMLRYHKDSARARDAMRLLGQMNLDRLLDPDVPWPGKKRVEVPRGGSLNKIAADHKTTWHYITRATGLSRPQAIQPNDQVWVCPLNFRAIIDVGAKTIVIMDGEYFFALFPIREIRRPPGAKIPAKVAVGQKFGVLDGKRVVLTDEGTTRAEKWIEIGRDWAIRSVPDAATPGQGFGVFVSEADAADLLLLLRSGNSVELKP